MTEAIFGLVGVIVGGAITGAVSYVLERRREEQRARASARLLELELEPFVHGLYALRASILKPDEDEFAIQARHVGELTPELWTANRETLAASLAIEEWYSVMYAYLALARLARELRGTTHAQAVADDGFAGRVQRVESAVSGAVDTLGRRAGRDVPDGEPTVLRASRW